MKLDHGRLHAHEEVAVYEYVNEYEYGVAAEVSKPQLARLPTVLLARVGPLHVRIVI
ncbi:hypothetical protein L6Q96_18105 [Candidatus Binatia bacterium]|nr:hypothetical protein [Candidatus Binatia bacterium]